MILPLQILAGTGSLAAGALFRMIESDHPGFMGSLFIGGIVGAVCFIPSFLLIDKKKLPARLIKPLLWTNVIAGAIAGLCLAIPVGLGTFFYLLNQMENKSK